jgi:flagellar hook-length control protein FliK
MNSIAALKSTDAAGATTAGESLETGDTGAFDALLALQSILDADTAATDAQQAGALDGAELLAGTLEESAEEPVDEPEEPDDALSFLAGMLPAPKLPVTAAAVASTSVPVTGTSTQAHTTAAPLAAVLQDATTDPALAAASGSTADEAGDAQIPALSFHAAAAIAAVTTSMNYLGGPADLFAQSTRQGVALRVEPSTMNTHVGDPRWADDLGHRLASMVRTGESSASLQLTPLDLGPLEINVSVRDSQATVHFGASNADTRALLEASMPRLREMLAAQGFELLDSSVSQGFARQTRHESAGTPRGDALGESPSVSAPQIHIAGLLDLYA